MPIRENKNIISGPVLRSGIQEGARKAYEAVGATFGPMSGNVIIQKNWGLARITHDGVTVAREVFLPDSVENAGATILSDASKKTLETAGDGTSATVILGYHILELANKSVVSGRNAMLMKRGISRAAVDAKAIIDTLKTDVQRNDKKPDETPKELIQVATISASGDEAIGNLVAETVSKVGNGVTIEEYNGLNIEKEVVEGYYFENGYAAPQLSQVIETVGTAQLRVLVVQGTVSRVEDIFPFLEKMVNAGFRKLLIVGRIHGHALQCAIAQVMAGKFEITIADAPIAGQQRGEFLQDVCAMTGARLLSNLDAQAKMGDLGKAERVVLTSKSTTIFGGQGDPEAVENRLAGIREQLKNETIEVVRMHLETRQAKLKGRVGIIRVGGATPTEVKEKKDRVDDAVKATQAALEDGIVAGGATTLIEVSRQLQQRMEAPILAYAAEAVDDVEAAKLVKKASRSTVTVKGDPKTAVTLIGPSGSSTWLSDEIEGYRIVVEALKAPFRVLMQNSGQEPASNLKAVQKAGYGWGYHAERPTEEPIELFPAGVLDPAKVLKMVVENGCSTAAELLTVNAGIFHVDLEKVEEIEGQD